MNQIRRKRRLSPLETGIIGNIAYLLIVVILKSIFDIIGRSGSFNYLFNGVELGIVAIFWIGLFALNFKNIYAGEKAQSIKYIFVIMIPIVLLTITFTIVSMYFPGQDSNSIWNQFSFLGAPTIFWYLPFGLIYQLIENYVSIFVFFGIAIIMTIIFQSIGIILGRVIGRKYWEETRIEAQEEAEIEKRMLSKNEQKKIKVKNKRTKGNGIENVGIDQLSDEKINEGFTPAKKQKIMTEVIIRDDQKELDASNMKKKTPLYKNQKPGNNSERIEPNYDLPNRKGIFENVEINQQGSNLDVQDMVENKVGKSVEDDTDLEKKLTEEWKLAHPEEENQDKSFFMETSQVRIISEEDIEEYYRNKK
jgi:hypothetical protein